MHPPDPIPFLPPPLSDQVRRRTNELLFKIIRTNLNTQFARVALPLTEFRDATAGLIDEMDHVTLSDIFRKTVQFTTYDLYAPFTERFFQKPCKESAVKDLLAPGLPDYLVQSSSTSGGVPKLFPKYDYLSRITSSDVSSYAISDPLQRRTRAYVFQFLHLLTHIEDEYDRPIRTAYWTGMSVVNRRSSLNLHPEGDKEKMALCILDHAAPYAAHFIPKWRSFLLIHVIFALSSRSLKTISIPYTISFVEMMRHLDIDFDMVVECIASGTIPDLDGIADVRDYLEMWMAPDPERAAELRSLGRPSSRPGWCSLAWPNLHSIHTTSSGTFAMYLPLARSFLGPTVEIHSRGYRCSEATVALPYNSLESNQYKLCCENIVEFLDITKNESITSLSRIWEVEVGGRYEVVLTTLDGLWRYRLADVIQVSGFDPTDGIPIIQFIERRNVALRFPWFMVSEAELNATILSIATNVAVQIMGWTAMFDNRRAPATIGFFVELVDEQAADLARATQHVLEGLSRAVQMVPMAIEYEIFRAPTIRLVQPGTFSQFLQMRVGEDAHGNIGQVKVPAVLSKASHIAWFSDRVTQEL